ncbi:hypothetical protein [Nocardia vermiculata]|uniref:Uncharacterized protein n=1 Tax=Nocardia vermiculata TaxID=257274 RepID=A0A846XX28_9NOCA|nr:hypothetical protein [Nocardia vermiculata]NKY51673.1 hypothetical protein [Nocardia vermiculata]
MSNDDTAGPRLFSHEDAATDSAPATAARTDLRPTFLAPPGEATRAETDSQSPARTREPGRRDGRRSPHARRPRPTTARGQGRRG